MASNFWTDMTVDGDTVSPGAPDVSIRSEYDAWYKDITIKQKEIIVFPKPEAGTINEENKLVATTVTIGFERPLSRRALTAVLLIIPFIFISGLAFVPDIGRALEVSVGVLIGLWGLGGRNV